MRACLNQSTLLPASIETFLRAAARAGFREVELRFSRVWETLDLRPAEGVRRLIADLGLRVVTLNSLEDLTSAVEDRS